MFSIEQVHTGGYWQELHYYHCKNLASEITNRWGLCTAINASISLVLLCRYAEPEFQAARRKPRPESDRLPFRAWVRLFESGFHEDAGGEDPNSCVQTRLLAVTDRLNVDDCRLPNVYDCFAVADCKSQNSDPGTFSREAPSRTIISNAKSKHIT